jgi:hypothetical protein
MNILLKGFTKFKFVSLCTLKILNYFGANIAEKTKYNCFAFCLNYVETTLYKFHLTIHTFLQYLVKTLVFLLLLFWLEITPGLLLLVLLI